MEAITAPSRPLKRERPKEAILSRRECYRCEWKDDQSSVSSISELSVGSFGSEKKTGTSTSSKRIKPTGMKSKPQYPEEYKVVGEKPKEISKLLADKFAVPVAIISRKNEKV
mmetsp:Transcript_11671/g.28757  ORF Transcript_11671/g.28757 Transcript_11671/m.28757 type:complete len:112 (-) Transcript_11671:293-628(-)